MSNIEIKFAGKSNLLISNRVLTDLVGLAEISKNLDKELEYSLFVFGYYNNDKEIEVIDYWIPKQENTGSYTEELQGDVDKLREILIEKYMVDKKIRFLGWWHSHTTKMGAFMSDTDLKTSERYNKKIETSTSIPMINLVFSFMNTDFNSKNTVCSINFTISSPAIFGNERHISKNFASVEISVKTPTKKRLEQLKIEWEKKVIYKPPPPPKTYKQTTFYDSKYNKYISKGRLTDKIEIYKNQICVLFSKLPLFERFDVFESLFHYTVKEEELTDIEKLGLKEDYDYIISRVLLGGNLY